MHRDDVAALCTLERVYLAPNVKAMPHAHPDRRFVEAKCLVAGAFLRGDVDGPYDDREADEGARILLELQPTRSSDLDRSRPPD